MYKRQTHTLYIVDEASMISNEGLSGAVFGTGRLLDDLIQFVYSGTGCRLVLMGDTAPVSYTHRDVYKRQISNLTHSLMVPILS